MKPADVCGVLPAERLSARRFIGEPARREMKKDTMRRLVVVNGHPDPRQERFCAALTKAYVRGGVAGGWSTVSLSVGELALSSLQALAEGDQPDADAAAMLAEIEQADRLALVFPLWFGKPPEPLSALFGRVAPRKAHVVVTMDMPAFAYRSILRGPERSPMLAVPGIDVEAPVLIGCVSSISLEQRHAWLKTLSEYGERTHFGSMIVPSRVQAFADMIDRTVAQLWA
jgi:Putative NADPH-quinone reductase (modulator of drug activity B)